MPRIGHALIMAAGRGMRMAPLTDAVPKPMAPFRGSTLIAQGIEKLAELLPNIHITVGYKGAVLAEHVIDLEVSSVFNTEGHPNAWWIHNTLVGLLDEPIYVLTCDNVVELDFERLEEDYAALGSPPCMLVPVEPVEGLEGDFIQREGSRVTAVGRDIESDIYCSGIQILNPARVRELTPGAEGFYEVWTALIGHGALHVSSVYPEKWIAIDTWEQLREANG